MIHENRYLTSDGDAIELDPFAFWPDIASRLVGLGGTDRSDEADYAFHTLYVACGTGPIVFTVRFQALQARRGTLIMRVHELPEVMGAHARQIAISQSQLTDIMRGDGSVTLPASARSGSSYALVGFIYGDTVATAADVAIEVARRSPDPHDPARPTAFRAGGNRVGSVPQIVGEREGDMMTPVSQPCTAKQVASPIFAALTEQLGGMSHRDVIDRWEQVYIARVLDRYDVARSGARGIGIGALSDRIVPWLVQHGCALSVTVAGDPPEGMAPPDGVEIVAMDPFAIDGPGGYDFAWATRNGGVGDVDRQESLRFVEDGLRLVKPGGLFVLVLPFDAAARPIGDDAGPMLRRTDIDRTVLLLLSRGHQVAQIRPWGEAMAEEDKGGAVMRSAFGLIVRRAV